MSYHRRIVARWISLAVLVGCTPAAALVEDDGAPPSAQLHFGGDVYLGEAYGTPSHRDGFDALAPILSTAPVVANLETALTHDAPTPLDEHKALLHWADPRRTVRLLAEQDVVAVSLANNHSMDYGLEALTRTRRALAHRHIVGFGAGASLAEASAPFAADFGDTRLHVIAAYWERPRYRDVYRFYAGGAAGGVRKLSLDDVAAQIAALDGTVVVFPHWGRNYRWRSDEQQRLAHALVDAGADLVIGHGAHNMQEIERHRGRWILYGIGNMVFLSPGRYDESEVPPYSLLVTLDPHAIRLRFIASDNQLTGYRPELLVDDAFDQALHALRSKSCVKQDDFCRQSRVAEDGFGRFVALPL